MIQDCLYGLSLMDFIGWRFEMFSSRQGSSFRGKKIIKPRITCSNITGLDSTNADCWVFYMGRLLEGTRLCLFSLHCLWSVRLLTLGSLVLQVLALGFFKNKLGVNDAYFSYFHLKDKVWNKKSFLSPKYCLVKNYLMLHKYLEWVTINLISSHSYTFQRTLK